MCDCFPAVNAGSGFSCFAFISPPLFLRPAAVHVSVLVVQYSLWLGAHARRVGGGGEGTFWDGGGRRPGTPATQPSAWHRRFLRHSCHPSCAVSILLSTLLPGLHCVEYAHP